MKRLLGYVVKLPDGTRHIEGRFSLLDAVSISHGSVPPTHVVPVFAARKPVVVPTQITTEEQARAFNALEPAPAPVVAGERYACWAGVCMWLTDGEDDPRDTGTRAEAEARAAGIPGAEVVRILPDGEHEAAVAQAVSAERARIYKLIDDADDDDPEVSEGLKEALRLMRQNGGSK